MTSLEVQVATTDPLLFKKFRQSVCSGPLAQRLLALHKPATPVKPVKKDVEEKKRKEDTSKKKRPASPNPQNTPEKPAKPKGTPLEGAALKALDTDKSLPQKDGKLDAEIYGKYPDTSLR